MQISFVQFGGAPCLPIGKGILGPNQIPVPLDRILDHGKESLRDGKAALVLLLVDCLGIFQHGDTGSGCSRHGGIAAGFVVDPSGGCTSILSISAPRARIIGYAPLTTNALSISGRLWLR